MKAEGPARASRVTETVIADTCGNLRTLGASWIPTHEGTDPWGGGGRQRTGPHISTFSAYHSTWHVPTTILGTCVFIFNLKKPIVQFSSGPHYATA